ncbi:S8 family serine peptidase [Spirulina sp. CS-785/01]|uniref:S8 family serine peptidase n=1 Tax=Spirulina sp. CS-785/01 TaxID=3021716 RepID=UPI00232C66B2|nr:S8 family serine peptidase [Spirulina sp. CS-785/01]MDB9315363.1 S8 family serine peptidase [Spirulina sp. CS-785/01]
MSVPETRIGITLQRGGEELGLLKVGDRFTLRLVSPDSQFPPELARLKHQSLPQSQLIEVLVEPDSLNSAMSIARSLDLVAFASHVYQLENNPETLIYLTDELTVQFAPAIEEKERETLTQPYHLHGLEPLDTIDNAFIYQLTNQTPENPIKLANRLAAKPDILTAEANIIVRQESFYQPQDDFYSAQWYLNHNGGSHLSRNSHIDCEKAWDITTGDRQIIIAITDDAIDINHPDFQGNGKIVHPKDFRDNDFSPLPTNSQESHGTACAGIALAEENGSGIVGVAPQCALMPLRTTGYLDDRSIEKLFNWAMSQGASVISCSWGAAIVHFPLSLRQKAILQKVATQGRNGKGCVIVFAAGNANRPVQGTIYERSWPDNLLQGPTEWLSGFAAHPDVITVSACTSLGKKAAYSNWGSHISLCAPSNNAPPGMWFQQRGYLQTAPRINTALPGKTIFTTDQLGQLGYDPGNFTRNFGGTSSACPVVAGVAALVLSVNPELTAQEVKQLLQDTADKIVDRDPDPQLGLQLGTYDRNGHSQWFGYGKVNAYKAVQTAKAKTQPPPPQTLEQENTNAIAIPDNELSGVRSTIQITESEKIRDLQIQLEIDHDFLGDIEVNLYSPQGEKILLQNRSLGSLTQLKQNYTVKNTPLLQRLFEQSSAGKWQLQVIDSVAGDTGTLKQWRLRITV